MIVPRTPACTGGGGCLGRASACPRRPGTPPVFSDIFEFFNSVGVDTQAQDLIFSDITEFFNSIGGTPSAPPSGGAARHVIARAPVSAGHQGRPLFTSPAQLGGCAALVEVFGTAH